MAKLLFPYEWRYDPKLKIWFLNSEMSKLHSFWLHNQNELKVEELVGLVSATVNETFRLVSPLEMVMWSNLFAFLLSLPFFSFFSLFPPIFTSFSSHTPPSFLLSDVITFFCRLNNYSFNFRNTESSHQVHLENSQNAKTKRQSERSCVVR